MTDEEGAAGAGADASARGADGAGAGDGALVLFEKFEEGVCSPALSRFLTTVTDVPVPSHGPSRYSIFPAFVVHLLTSASATLVDRKKPLKITAVFKKLKFMTRLYH